MYFLKVLLSALFCAVAFSACASMGDIAKLENLYYQAQDLDLAYNYAKKYSDDDFLWALQSGILAYQIGDFAGANAYLDSAEGFFEGTSGENAFKGGLKTFASILVSNGMFEYKGAFFESVFANHYKALSAIMTGDFASARVEFNRANDRHRRAKDCFSDYILARDESIRQSAGEYGQETNGVNVAQSYDSALLQYKEHYQNLRAYKAFEGYVNPYISYVSGIFFLSQNDFEKAQNLLKESYAITNQKAILSDIKIAESRKNGNKKRYSWIIIEEGQIPKKEEIRFDLPLFFVNSSVLSFNIALPVLRESYEYKTNYNARYIQDSIGQSILDEKSGLRSHERGDRTSGSSTKRVASLPDLSPKDKPVAFEIADISPLVNNEFQIELPYIIFTSLLSSSYKAYLQYFLGEKLGIFGSLAGAIFSYASTRADIRSVRILPLRFYILRVENKGDFALFNGAVKLGDFALTKCEDLCDKSDNLIYIRAIKNDIISILFHKLNGESK
ncbi:hypothetical protein [Helicobacter sp. 23-1045]